MKEKIFNAIGKGLMNVLSTDISDQDIDFNHDNIDNEYMPYEYRTVDMGTGILWCEYNIGAFPENKASDWYGGYYAWGETEVKDDYSWKTYKHCKGTENTITKYNKKDMLAYLNPKDDAVTKILGEKFRTPTREEYKKLIKDTTNEWIKNYKGIYGLNGRLFTAENGNTLFFPAAGSYDGTQRQSDGEYGSVWSSSLYSDNILGAFTLCFYPDGSGVFNDGRYIGLPVRGVQNSL